MKKLIYLLFFLNMLLGFAQNNKISKIYDEFNKTNKFSINNIKIAKNNNSRLKCDLSKRCDEGSIICIYSFYFYTEKPIGCVTSKSYATFLFDNKNTKTLDYEGSIDCGTYAIYFTLLEEDFKEIIENKLSKVRIHTDTDFDYELTIDEEIKLKETMKSLLTAK